MSRSTRGEPGANGNTFRVKGVGLSSLTATQRHGSTGRGAARHLQHRCNTAATTIIHTSKAIRTHMVGQVSREKSVAGKLAKGGRDGVRTCSGGGVYGKLVPGIELEVKGPGTDNADEIGCHEDLEKMLILQERGLSRRRQECCQAQERGSWVVGVRVQAGFRVWGLGFSARGRMKPCTRRSGPSRRNQMST